MSEANPPEPVASPGAESVPQRRSLTKSRRRAGSGLAAGKVVGTAFRIWANNLVTFTLLGLVCFVPYGCYSAWLAGHPVYGDPETQPRWVEGADHWLTQLSGLFVMAPVIGAVFAELRGQRASFATLGQGLARLPRALGVLFTLALILGLPLIVMMLFVAVVVTGPVLFVGVTLATLAILIFVTLAFFVAVPAVVVERCGIFAALRRSLDLTRGSRAKLFLVLFLFRIVGALIAMAVGGVVGLAFPDLPEWLWTTATVAVLSSIEASLTAVVYHELRLAVDGVDAEEIARVFE
ncbi:MAG: hypothetical protein IT457_07885 [Planctomycetes bacterium]|nr:hypothetical protein [Planctomycetota bacterium]